MTTIDTALLTSTSYDLSTTKSNDYVFTSLDGSKVAMDYSIDGNNLVAKASEKVSYILKATVGTAGVVDAGTHEYAVNDVIELKLAKSGDVGAKPNTWMWQSTTAYNVDAQGALLPGETEKHYIYMDLEYGDFTDTTAINAANFGIGGLKFSSIAIYKSVDGADAVALDSSEISAFITNYKAAIYDSEAGEPLSLAERSAVNKKINDLATTPAEYTFVNYAKEGVDATVKVTDKTHDSFDLANYDWVVKADEDDEFIGTRLGETADSTIEDEVFTMGTGNDKINFKGNFGDDTVVYTAGEDLSLTIKTMGGTDVTPVATVSGDDVVLTAENTYALNVTVDKGAKVDGFDVKAGDYTMQLVKSGSVGEHANECMFQLTPNYNGATAEEPHYVYIYLDKSDFNLTDGKVTGIKDQVWKPNSNTNITLKNLELVHTTIDGTVDFAQGYYDGIGEQTAAVYGENLWKEQVSGSITISGMAKSDIADKKLKVNSTELENLVFTPIADKKGTTFTGSRFDDVVESTEENETFDLKTSILMGSDKVRFSGEFGDDTVKLTKDERVELAFDFNNTLGTVTDVRDVLSYSTKGSDLVISTDVEYILKATVSADGWVDNEKNVIKKGDYEFVLAKSGDVGAKPNTWMWRMQDAYNVDAKGKIQDGSENKHYVYMDLENGDFTVTAGVATLTASNFDMTSGANLHFSSLELVQRLNGDSDTDTVITTNYYKKLQTLEDKTVLAQRSALNETIYDDQLQGSITVNNFNNVFTWAGVTNPGLSINNTNIANVKYEIEADKKNKFTGTVMNDVANSTVEDETFDLKSSMGMNVGDTINFTGDFGDDTVILNKGETINLNFGDNATYTYEVAGKDLKITANDYYYAEFTVTADATYDSVTYKAGEKYRLDLVKVGKSSNEAALPSGSYAWGYAAREATAAEQAAGYTGKIYLYADLADVNDGNIGGLGAGNATITFHHVTTEGDNTVTKTKIYGADTVANVATLATKNATLYNAQAVGTVILKDYAAKDTGATIYVNDATHTNPAFEAKFIKGVDDVVKGKVTGTSAKDVVDVAKYVSPDGVKGLTINTGSGNDTITGTSFNDTVTIKTLEGQTAKVTQVAGTNKVTFGKGDDVFYAASAVDYDTDTDTDTVTDGGYSSSTVNMGTGDNTVYLSSVGTNKITAKNGENTVTVKDGSNTITLGNASDNNTVWYTGHNTVTLKGGQNKVTSGKGVDKYTIAGGNNVINSGAGEDTFTYTGAGYNTIKTGAGNKTFTGVQGTNNITTGKGDDTFVITSGKNIIKSNAGDDTFTFAANSTTTAGDYTIVDGGAGNDTYDISALAINDYVTITDKAGDNTIVLGDKLNIFFDVTNVKAQTVGGVTTAKSYKIGNEMLFTQNATYTANQGVDVTFKGGKNGATNFEAQIGASTYNINLDAVASAVAGWLANHTDYKSAYDGLNNATGDDFNNLIACYTSNPAQNYVDPSALA